MDELKEILDTYSSSALNEIAAFNGVLPHGPKTKQSVIEVLARHLMGRARILKTYQELNPSQKTVLAAILRRGGKTSVRNMLEELAKSGLVEQSPAGNNRFPDKQRRPEARAANSRRLEDILARLNLLGLVFSAEELAIQAPYPVPKRDISHAFTSVVIPEAIRQHLPVPPALPVQRETPEVKTVLEGSARTFQRDLYLYWSYVRDQHPALTARGDLQKKALREVSALLLTRSDVQKGETEKDHPRLLFLRELLLDLKLITLRPDGSLEAVDSPGFFSLTPVQRVAKVYEAWSSGKFFNELILLPADVSIKTSYPPLIPAPEPVIKARKFVLEQIFKTSAEGWAPVSYLTGQVRTQNYEFLFRRNYPSRYYYGLRHPYDASTNPMGLSFPGITDDEKGWERVEANFIQGILRGPMFWMGLIDLGWKGPEKEAPEAFRLTALGRWVLKLGPEPDVPMEGGRVIVQPNLHIIALDPISDVVLMGLDRFAERLAAERAIEYRLTRLSVYKAQRSGWNVAQIKEFLVQHTGSSLPGNVERTLEEWQAQYERITFHPQATLAHGSPELLDRISKENKTSKWIASRPLPDVAILQNQQAIPRLVNWLHAQEILPLTVQPGVRPGSIRVVESGEIELNEKAASIYLHGQLSAIADRIETGYRLTPASIQRAVQSGLSAPEMVSLLQAMSGRPVPEEVAKKIRAWSKYYGDAVVENVVLLQVKDPNTLQALLKDPELKHLLKEFTMPAGKALARIQPKDLEKLRMLLAERGVEILDKK